LCHVNRHAGFICFKTEILGLLFIKWAKPNNNPTFTPPSKQPHGQAVRQIADVSEAFCVDAAGTTIRIFVWYGLSSTCPAEEMVE
jgi:hypothetical protein